MTSLSKGGPGGVTATQMGARAVVPLIMLFEPRGAAHTPAQQLAASELPAFEIEPSLHPLASVVVRRHSTGTASEPAGEPLFPPASEGEHSKRPATVQRLAWLRSSLRLRASRHILFLVILGITSCTLLLTLVRYYTRSATSRLIKGATK